MSNQKSHLRKSIALGVALLLILAGLLSLFSVGLSSISKGSFAFSRGFSEPGSQKTILVTQSSLIFSGPIAFQDNRLPRKVEWHGSGEYRRRMDFYEGGVEISIPEINFRSREGVLALSEGSLGFVVMNIPQIERVKKVSVTIVAPGCAPASYHDLKVLSGQPSPRVEIPSTLLVPVRKGSR